MHTGVQVVRAFAVGLARKGVLVGVVIIIKVCLQPAPHVEQEGRVS